MTEFYATLEANRKWIAGGILVALLVWESLVPFFPFFVHRLRKRAVHLTWNVLLGALNAVIIALVFVKAWSWAADFAADQHFGILHWFDGLPVWAGAVLAVLLFDIWTYWWHRMNHRVPFFWRFHKVHHSDPHMDVTTANRFHFGEIILSSILRVPVILLIGAELWHLALYEAILFPIVQFHHANVAVGPWMDRLLRVFITTPEMHKVHHSRWQPETDSNYTSLLSVWDRVFRSFRLRKDPHEISFGLDGYDVPSKQNLWGLLRTPIGNKRHPKRNTEGD